MLGWCSSCARPWPPTWLTCGHWRSPRVPRIGRAPAPMEADYANAIRRAGVWVAVQHDLLVGLLVLVPQPDHLLVENVAVLPSTQGHGIGTGLLDLAESQARRHGLAERQASVS
jgi:ribosomal protein S18 acetylase RimI-like enzyme